MRRLLTTLSALALAGLAQPALAQPAADAVPLLQILQSLESGGNVAYFDQIEWDDDGY